MVRKNRSTETYLYNKNDEIKISFFFWLCSAAVFEEIIFRQLKDFHPARKFLSSSVYNSETGKNSLCECYMYYSLKHMKDGVKFAPTK